MRYNANRLGEQYLNVTAHWVASITNASEFRKVSALKVGETVKFERGLSGSVGAVTHLVVTRVS